MANIATLSRNGTSVDIDLVGEGGDLSVARDLGKPNLDVNAVGAENPIHQDYQNAQDVWTVIGFLIGSNAYSDARTLAEDIIKPRLSSALTLDLSDLPERSTYDVVPAGQSACTLTYVPGTVDIVGVQCSLPVVSTVQGGTQNSTAPGSPGSGDGIKLTRTDDSTSVTLSRKLTLTREVGRPELQLNPTNGELPIAIDENAPAADTWQLSGALVSSATATASTLEADLLRPRLGDAAITLEFLGNQWGLQKYQTIPTGTQSLRTALSAGANGVVDVPTLELQSVRT
jgi:hypothetical protein